MIPEIYVFFTKDKKNRFHKISEKKCINPLKTKNYTQILNLFSNCNNIMESGYKLC